MVNPFSIILIIIVFYFLSTKKGFKYVFLNLFVLEIIFSLFRINVGYFLKIGNFEIQNDDVLLGVLFVMSIVVFSSSIAKNIKIRQLSAAFIIIIIIGVFNLYVFPAQVGIIAFNTGSWDLYMRGVSELTQPIYSMQSILMFIRVLIFLAIMVAAKDLFTRQDYILIGKRLYFFSKLFLIFGIIEFILSFVLKIDISSFLNLFFGRGLASSGDFGRLQGLSREPSYYSQALFNVIILLYSLSKIDCKRQYNYKKYKIWIIIAFFLGLISGSFAFILATCSLLVFFYMISNLEKRKSTFSIKPSSILVAIFGILGITIFISFINITDFTFYTRILESLNQLNNGVNGTYTLGDDYSSEAVRLISSTETFKATLSRPIFGLGIGTAYSVSGIISILSNIGFLGLYIWYQLISKEYYKTKNKILIIIILTPIIFTGDMYSLSSNCN
jgi:hypothetical protein